MYANFFGLKHEPFSIAPDPRYLFMSERHREALAHLLYGLRGGGGFVLLTGEIGAGKTTVCRCFLEQIPKRCNVAYVFNPKLTATELLSTICEEYRIELPSPPPATVKPYVDAINEFLLRTHAVGQNNVLIIDEAQNLAPDVLEQLRLLTNLETAERKLLQIILIGQPELRDMLARPELEQLAQRVIARFHLTALSEKETAQYVRHRLGVAGYSGSLPFDREALRRIHHWSRGVPRRINLLCDRALLGAYGQGRRRAGPSVVDGAAAEVFDRPRANRRRLAWGVGGAAVMAAAAAAAMVAVSTRAPAPPSPGTAAVTRPAATRPAAVASAPASAAPAPAPAPAPRPAASFALGTTEGSLEAWRALGAAWGVKELAAPDCNALREQHGLHCFDSDDGLAQLRLLGRPALLDLQDDAGRRGQALLVALDGERAQLRIGSASQTVTLATLSKLWQGRFITLWRQPEGYEGRPIPGAQADWLAALLARARGEQPPAGPQRFDAALQARVAAFQKIHGLRSDGRAGPITVMQLNRAAGIDEPRLSTTTASAAAKTARPIP